MVIVIALMVIIGATTTAAQERELLVPQPQSEMTIEELSEEVYDEVKSLHAFEAMPLPDSPERRRTLEIRLDEKTINLLKNIMALSRRVLAKPEDAPERATLRQLVQARGIEIEETLVLRFSSLTERLNQSLARQASLSGAALLSEESLGELLDGQRLQYLSLASELAVLMKTLELEETDLRKKVISTLTYFGDEMMGLVHLHRHGLSMLSARSAADGTDADLLQAARFESERLELAIKRLRKVVTQLELLGGDTLEMRRTLIEERRGLALTLVDTAVINVLYAEISGEVRDWLSVRGGERQLDLEDIVEIRSIEEQLADQLDLKVTSTIYADPNAVTLSLSTSGTYDTRGGRTGFSGRIDDNQTKALDAEGDTVKTTLNSSNFTLYREFWRSRGAAQSYRVLNAVYSSNDALGVDHRFSMGVGLGRYFIQELGHELAVSTGIQGVQERKLRCDERLEADAIDCAGPESGDGDLIDNAAELFFNMQWH